MTDPTAPPHPDDERLSAVLDGEGRPADDAHADSCPACATRLSQLRAVAAAVGAPVGAADPDRRAAAIAAALAVADTEDRAEVVSINRARRPIPLPRWLAAAAVLLLLALAIPAAVRFAGEGGDDDDSATSAATTMAAAEDAAGAGAEAAPPAELRTRDAGDLGEIDADTNLPERLGLVSAQSADNEAGATTTMAEGGTTTEAPTTAASAAVPCEDAVRADDPELGSLLSTAEARFDGDPVVVLGFETDGEVRVYAVAVDTCELRTVQTAR